MKNIKSYKLFESREEILQDIKDIGLELNDIGIEVIDIDAEYFNRTGNLASRDGYDFTFRIGKNVGGFTIHEVYDVIHRMIDYMKMNGYEFKIYKHLRRRNLNITNDFKTEKKFSQFNKQRIPFVIIQFSNK